MEQNNKSNKRNTSLEQYEKVYTHPIFKYTRIFVHSIGAGQFIYASIYWNITSRAVWGGKFQFLTYLDLILQGTYHSISLLNDFFGSNELDPETKPFLRKMKDTMFTSIAFPAAQNVSFTFWTLYAYNRQLILPQSLDAVFPSWFNHIVHSNITIFAFLDMMVCFRKYPKRNFGILITSITALSYIGWLHITRYQNGRWAYPFLNAVNMPMRFLMFTSFVGLNVLNYLFGEYVNNLFWAPEFKLLEQKSSE